MSVASLFKKCVATIIAVLMVVLPAFANGTADSLLMSLPPAQEGWSLQTGSQQTEAGGVKAFGMYTLAAEDRLFVIELDAGGQIVAVNAGAWDAQMLIAEIAEIGNLQYQVAPDMLTALINGKILIRAYSPDADEREIIKLHLEALNTKALEALVK